MNVTRNIRLKNSGIFSFVTILALLAVSASSVQARTARVMFLGDSLISSINGQASFRYWLWKGLQARRYNVDFVGSLWGVGNGASGIYGDFDQDHEGHPGATSDYTLFGVDYWAGAAQPDIVVLITGGNDFEEGKTPLHALTNSRDIIYKLRAQNPRVVILWATLPTAAGQQAQVRSYNSGVLRYSKRWSTAASPIRVVDLYSNFQPSRFTVDGIHPNEIGERIIAKRVYNQLAPIVARYR